MKTTVTESFFSKVIPYSTLICGANQWTGFYMTPASLVKGLREFKWIDYLLFPLKWSDNQQFSDDIQGE